MALSCLRVKLGCLTTAGGGPREAALFVYFRCCRTLGAMKPRATTRWPQKLITALVVVLLLILLLICIAALLSVFRLLVTFHWEPAG